MAWNRHGELQDGDKSGEPQNHRQTRAQGRQPQRDGGCDEIGHADEAEHAGDAEAFGRHRPAEIVNDPENNQDHTAAPHRAEPRGARASFDASFGQRQR